MTINGKPIAILACLQISTAFLFYLAGVLGTGIVDKLHGVNTRDPEITQLCFTLGLWPLVAPMMWTVIVLVRAHCDAPNWEMAIWFVAAVLFCVMVGLHAIGAVISPLVIVY